MDHHLRNAHKLAKLMDSQFSFLGYRFGYDGLIGLIPGVGDLVTYTFSFYLIWIGIMYKIPTSAIALMLFNTTFDLILGFIPFIGDASDFFYKSSAKNFKILQKHCALQNVIEGEKVYR